MRKSDSKGQRQGTAERIPHEIDTVEFQGIKDPSQMCNPGLDAVVNPVRPLCETEAHHVRRNDAAMPG
ncbi:hypothetical protein T1E_4264 [Pseudomonas putida DOT-T1E]|uniref:Uncharacterized protein n=1 Tax=Pseudomonas putida (strain DOT-T1E) TaxID=1196325 RepID=I7BEI9_PSEPT|nr:hypothetical protein T1E_4264 [Pseudomonas putida DOT-T1E]